VNSDFLAEFSRSLPSGITNKHLPALRLSHTAPTARFLPHAAKQVFRLLYSTTSTRPSLVGKRNQDKTNVFEFAAGRNWWFWLAKFRTTKTLLPQAIQKLRAF